MSGSNASPFTPLVVGQSDSGDFSSWLGRPVQIGNETYVMVQAAVAIASGKNGMQLVCAVSGGVGNFIVALATGAAGTAEFYNCGAIPAAQTVAVVSGAYFLALRDSPGHVLLVTPATTGGTGGVNEGTILMPSGTGSTLVPVNTAAVGAVTGTTVQIENLGRAAGQSLELITAVVAVSASVMYHAPFRDEWRRLPVQWRGYVFFNQHRLHNAKTMLSVIERGSCSTDYDPQGVFDAFQGLAPA